MGARLQAMQSPLVLIVGYLGAGKTTFLQRVVPALGARGVRPRVVLNDYQDARVDAARLAALDALVTPISGDCICCGSRQELLDALVSLDQVPGSVVLIEANGTSDAAELHDVLALDPRLMAFSRPIQVTVVDARRWQKRWFDKRLEREQAETASHLWLNWCEGVAFSRIQTVAFEVASVNPGAQQTSPADFADYLAGLVRSLADQAARTFTPRPTAHRHDHDGRHHFASLGVEFPAIVRRERLNAMVLEFANEIRRAKGVIAFTTAPERQVAWSYVAGDDAIRTEDLPEAGFATVAVFIGATLPEERLLESIRELGV